MKKIIAISLNTFREAIRNKILYSILGFAILMIGASWAMAQMQMGGFDKVMRDVGMASIHFFGVLIAIFLGVGLLNREIERRTIYTIISKPISRSQFLIGKYLGLNFTLIVNLAIMLVAFYLVLAATFGNFVQQFSNVLYLKSFILILGECLILTALAILFSTFSSVILSAMFCIGFFIVGHLLSDIKYFALKSDSSIMKSFIDFMYYALPNLERFNIKEAVSHNFGYDWSLVGLNLLYSLVYAGLLLVIAMIIFSRRDYK